MTKRSWILVFVLIFGSSCFAQVLSEKKKSNKGLARNIILMIGDGMGVSQIYAGITVNGKLNIEQFKDIGFAKTHSANDYITDSGASGTAIATGFKTYNKAIGVDIDTVPRPTILEYAEHHYKATGLVATSKITHATPACFISHQKDRYMYEEIALDFLNTDIDVFIGGGCKYFNNRKDGRDLTTFLETNNYQMVYKLKNLKKVKKGKLAGLLYDDDPPRASKGRKDMLTISSLKSVELLNQNKEGFFLMIEGSQIDWGGHDNNTAYITSEMIDFDKAVGELLKFAKQDGNTLVIVTADHETGGMGLVEGDLTEKSLKAKYTSGDHTGVMVPVFAYGPGSELFKGIYDNTDLFRKMMEAFGFEHEKF